MDLEGYEPLNNTLGVNMYAFALISSLFGLYITRNDEHVLHNFWSGKDWIKILIKSAPCFLGLILIESSWKGYSVAAKLFIKCFIPSFFVNLYVFGYSNRLVGIGKINK